MMVDYFFDLKVVVAQLDGSLLQAVDHLVGHLPSEAAHSVGHLLP